MDEVLARILCQCNVTQPSHAKQYRQNHFHQSYALLQFAKRGFRIDTEQGMKDWLIQKTVPTMLNQGVLKPYGELTALKFDSKLRSVEGELMLKGERELIRLRINSYDLVPEGERTYIIINDLISSREWITRLAQEYVVGKRFLIPDSVAKYASMVA